MRWERRAPPSSSNPSPNPDANPNPNPNPNPNQAGPAILLTSLTNLVAFVVAASVDFPAVRRRRGLGVIISGRCTAGLIPPPPSPPGPQPPDPDRLSTGRAQVRYFCFSAGIIIFLLFLLTATFFLALLTLDERRRARRALDCACCLTYPALATTAPATTALATTTPAATESVMDSGGTKGADAKANGQADSRQANGRGGEQREGEGGGRGGGRGEGSWAHRALRSYARAATHPLVSAVIVVLFLSFIPLGFGGTSI